MTEAPMVGARVASPVNVGANVGSPGNDPPLKDVLVELWQNLEKLVRQEIALASAELDVKAQRLKGEVAAAAIGAGLMLAGSLALVAAIILVLALFMPAWTASLVTGVAAAGAGFGLVKAKKPTAADVTPERTIANLKKDLRTFTESTK
jgi:cytochrome c-type biogenesis protein CcmH/NrfG